MTFEYWGHSIPSTTEERLALGTALVMVDLQRDFVHPDGHCGKTLDISGFRAVMPANRRLVELARRHRIPIVYTMVTQHREGAYASARWIADNLRYPNFEPKHCIEGSWGWEIDDEVRPQPEDVQLRKYRRSAFEGTNLREILRAWHVETLIVSGVAATGCVDRTVRDAIEKDYFVVVPRDAIGDATSALVEAACETFERLLLPGDLTTIADLEKMLASVRG
ncbi:MAG TPA: isochorismatase family cysteine hydrolase [Acidimicrobiales bacterium]